MKMNSLILRKIILITMTLYLSQFFLNTSYSVEPDEILNNPKYELRARNISKNIRCMVCQNQSIDESNAPLAKDLRILIREKIKEGSKDDEIYEFWLVDVETGYSLSLGVFSMTTSSGNGRFSFSYNGYIDEYDKAVVAKIYKILHLF